MIKAVTINDREIIDASAASHLFQSIIVDGEIKLIDNYDEKADALQALMEKYQPEGKHKHLSDKSINATKYF